MSSLHLYTLSATVVTWNVGNAKGLSKIVSQFLEDAGNGSDVIVFGFQEVGMGRRRLTKLPQSFGSFWLQVCHEQYGGMRIVVYVKSTAQERLKFRYGMRVGVGLVDRWPNKGAVGVEISFGQFCTMCFVSAHLAANETQVQERNSDWEKIMKRMDNVEFITSCTSDSAVMPPLFHRYDHLFFFGDLNYRLVPSMKTHHENFLWVCDKINAEDYSSLDSVDQLLAEREKRNIFVNFEEAPICFAPTYKIDSNSDDYCKLRIPSYCDRILWHSLPSRRHMIKCFEYNSPNKSFGSDHRPVLAKFQISTPQYHIFRYPSKRSENRGLRVTLDFLLVRIHGFPNPSRRKRLTESVAYKANRTKDKRTGSKSFFIPREDSLTTGILRERSSSMPSEQLHGSEQRSFPAENDEIGRIDHIIDIEDEDDITDENNCNEELANCKKNADCSFISGMKPDIDVGPRKRESIHGNDLPEAKEEERSKMPYHRDIRMEVHGRGIFLKESSVYRVAIPYQNRGIRERIGESLPAIPLAPLKDLEALRYEHLVLVAEKQGSRIGYSGVLPLVKLIDEINKPYSFEMDLTKYGSPSRKIEACVQMVVSENGTWVDSTGKLVRNEDMSSSRNYRGPLQKRDNSKVRTVPLHK